jgi:hypothetical protein
VAVEVAVVIQRLLESMNVDTRVGAVSISVNVGLAASLR